MENKIIHINEILKIERIVTEITWGDMTHEVDTFVPMERLMQIALKDIYGYELLCTSHDIIAQSDYFAIKTKEDERNGKNIGFSLTWESGWKEFCLSYGDQTMKIDQYKLFKQLERWGFALELYYEYI